MDTETFHENLLNFYFQYDGNIHLSINDSRIIIKLLRDPRPESKDPLDRLLNFMALADDNIIQALKNKHQNGSLGEIEFGTKVLCYLTDFIIETEAHLAEELA